MIKVVVSLVGCDDSTDLQIEVDMEDYLFLKRLVAAVNRKAHGCMPKLRVRRKP